MEIIGGKSLLITYLLINFNIRFAAFDAAKMDDGNTKTCNMKDGLLSSLDTVRANLFFYRD